MSWTASRTGQWFVSGEGTRWWFDSGAISLDFAYTGSMGGRPEWERWHTPVEMAAWVRERFDVTLPVDEAELAEAKVVRDAVASLIGAAADGKRLPPAAVRTVDAWAGNPDLPPQLASPLRPTLDRVLATIARDAVIVLRDRRDRIRLCRALDCQIVYLDTSRSNNRTWCSMKRCGNRNKIRELRTRQRQQPTQGGLS